MAEVEEESVAAQAVRPAAAGATKVKEEPEPPDPSDDGVPVGPSASEETALLAEEGKEEVVAPDSLQEAPETDPAPLPPLDDLVQRIPAPTRELLDELFRAKFITVKRLPKSAFKT